MAVSPGHATLATVVFLFLSTLPGEADLVQYIHDGLQKRREVKVTDNSVVTSDVWYRYDMGWNALATYDIGANGSTAWDIGTRTQSVTYLGMTPLAEVPGSNPSTGAYRHYLHDHLGSTRALYDGSKVLLARVAYTPYGEQAASTAGAEATYTFTGKQWEEETGLYFFPYRYYAPDLSRWTSRDPLGMVDGINLYEYATSIPIGGVDPLGLFSESWWECVNDCFTEVCTPIGISCAVICAAAGAICLFLPGTPACIAATAACSVFTRAVFYLLLACMIKCALEEYSSE